MKGTGIFLITEIEEKVSSIGNKYINVSMIDLDGKGGKLKGFYRGNGINKDIVYEMNLNIILYSNKVLDIEILDYTFIKKID